MKAIGGYFELADYEEGVFPHKEGILLNTGRNALEYILRSIGDITRIYIPYYTCDVVLEPIKKLHIPSTYYHINARFEIDDEVSPQDGEYIVANNYFGIKDAYIQTLAEKYGDHLIVDCAQAFFAKPISGIKSFYSPRKYLGVADGGIAYLGNVPDGRVQVKQKECTSDHDSHLFKRKQLGAEAGFSDYQENESKLDNQPIRWMSDATKEILNHIDYEKVVAKRREHYNYLHDALRKENNLALPELESFVCPMVYPFVTKSGVDFRKELISNKIFVARYWPNIQHLNDFEIEYYLTNSIIPLPCDQRYGIEEMHLVIEQLLSYDDGNKK